MALVRLAALLGALALLMPAPAAAAEADAPRPAVTVSPAFRELTITQTQPQAEFEVKVRNPSSRRMEFALNVVDFGSLDESGGVAFLGVDPSGQKRRHGLAPWMRLSAQRLSVDPGQTGTVKALVENRRDLAPGGHYGAVILTPVDPDPAKDGNVRLRQSISSLVLVKKLGGEFYDLRLQEAETDGRPFSVPNLSRLRFGNTGNVHAVPRGMVRVVDPRGRVVAKGIINPASSPILPASIRRYRVELDALGPAVIPGTYRVITQYRHDATDEVSTREDTVLVLLTEGVLAGILVLFAAGLGAVWLKSARRKPSS